MNENAAVENVLLNLLAAGETNYEFPTLQRDAAALVAKNFTEIIYSTLKQKSASNSSKRSNLLKLINLTCQTPEIHLCNDQYKLYLHTFKVELSAEPTRNLVDKISKELNDIPLDLQTEVSEFFKRKNGRRRNVVQKQELIRQMDQDSLPEGFGSGYSRNVLSYETSQSLVNELLKTKQLDHKTKKITLNTNTEDYRKKQVQFCYALVNLSNSYSEIKILQEVLGKIADYQWLEKFEWQLLEDLWLKGEKRKRGDKETKQPGMKQQKQEKHWKKSLSVLLILFLYYVYLLRFVLFFYINLLKCS
ncbi:uncharacterized protein LOC126750104 [Anthonomus grandis grandis]|uniref:uncharacterized protein LOC126750104 n=1 Tax=Anthonomus grandis grandis TaxID=2921223 RepID=UPI0021653970|nr:uncharacterized protein LOC126750104 [Anthonomus grandis grandis]